MTEAQPKKTVFVIMPFGKTPTRDKTDLTAFFEHNLKGRIESDSSLRYDYIVRRSDDVFLITRQILVDLYEADIVICDLSGDSVNPNIMYELGIRLAVSSNPVILIREAHPENRQIFDIQDYYIHEYSPLRYNEVTDHVVQQLREYEEGREFVSPVLETLKSAPSVREAILQHRRFERLRMFHANVNMMVTNLVSAILDFIRRTFDVPDPKNGKEFYFWIQEHRDALEPLDWEPFSLKHYRHPAIEAFLVEPCTLAMTDAESESRFLGFVMAYYNAFMQDVGEWSGKSLNAVVALLHETMILDTLARGLMIAAFRQLLEGQRDPRLSDMIRDCLNSSYLREFIDIAVAQIRQAQPNQTPNNRAWTRTGNSRAGHA